MKLKAWLCAFALLVAPTAHASIVHLGYSVADGVNALFNVGSGLVVGGSHHVASFGYKDNASADVTMTAGMTMAKIGWYSEGLGEDSWYVTGGVGKMRLKGTGRAGALETDGSTTANSASLLVGRHFFISFMDVKIGIGALNFNGWQDAEMRDPNGTLISTVPAKEFPNLLPALDFGVGVCF